MPGRFHKRPRRRIMSPVVVALIALFCVVTNLAVLSESASTLSSRRDYQSSDPSSRLRGLDLSRDVWVNIPSALHEVLSSIDDKLRGIDTYDYTVKLARLDFSMEQMVRRLENIESKLSRFETKFDLRMEKVEEVVLGKDRKEEFSNEHLSRRMGDLNEKLNNKAAFLDAKIDIKMEKITSKLDLLERDLQSSADDILERIVKSDEHRGQFETSVVQRLHKLDSIENTVTDLKMFLKEELPVLVRGQTQQLVATVDRNTDKVLDRIDSVHGTHKSNGSLLDVVQRIEGSFRELRGKSSDSIGVSSCGQRSRLRHLGPELLQSSIISQNYTDQKLENITTMLQKVFKASENKMKDLDMDVEVYARKIINSVQELWKSSQEIKTFLLDALEQGNRTRTLVREEFKKAQEQIRPLLIVEPKLNSVRETLDKRVGELSAAVDNSFATILVAQNTFIASCHRIQEEEAQVYTILEQILLEMRNRSATDMQRISTELRSHTIEEQKMMEVILNSIVSVGNNATQELRNLLKSHRDPRGNDAAAMCPTEPLITGGDEEEPFSDVEVDNRLEKHDALENRTNFTEYDYDLADDY